MQSRTKRIIGSILGCLIVLALAAGLFGLFGMKAEGQGAKQTEAGIPAEQVIASIRTAVAAKPGDVRAVEAENEAGKVICEVEILAQDGKTYEVKVDVATNTVIEIEIEIENFGKVNDHFYRGAQPKGRHYEQLAALGVKTIVDLRADARGQARADAERAGLRYLNLPLREKRYPPAEAAAHFLKIVNNQANWPVYVHCKGGRHRTGAMTAVYRMAMNGWNVEQAYQEMKQYDFYTKRGHQCFEDYVYDYHRELQAQPNRLRETRARSGN